MKKLGKKHIIPLRKTIKTSSTRYEYSPHKGYCLFFVVYRVLYLNQMSSSAINMCQFCCLVYVLPLLADESLLSKAAPALMCLLPWRFYPGRCGLLDKPAE
jgi:hypothetical protein